MNKYLVHFPYTPNADPIGVTNDKERAERIAELINRERQGTEAPEAEVTEIYDLDSPEYLNPNNPNPRKQTITTHEPTPGHTAYLAWNNQLNRYHHSTIFDGDDWDEITAGAKSGWEAAAIAGHQALNRNTHELDVVRAALKATNRTPPIV
ncbi:MAG TPA: hypothetical protein VNO31_31545 [Umezawaea sp.]|nr:hypothetical protein [Umezawaea sp.]